MRIFSIVFAFLFLTLSTPTLSAQGEGSAVAPDPQTTNFDITIVKTEQKSAQKPPALKREQCLNETESKPACAVVNRKDDKVDMERRFLVLERELLDRESAEIVRWLNMILVFLGAGAIWVTLYVAKQVNDVTKQTKAANEDREKSAKSAKNSAASAAFSEGNMYLGQKKYAAAIDAYTRAIDINPYDVNSYNNRGVAKGDSGQHEAAIEDYTKTIRLEPDYVLAHNNLGIAKQALNKHTEAIKDFDAAIRLDSEYADAYNNLGIAKQALNRHAEAIKDFENVIRLKPDYADAHNNCGISNYREDNYNDSIPHYTEYIRLQPDNYLGYANRGAAYLGLGEFKNARQDFSQSIYLLKSQNKLDLAQGAEKILMDLRDTPESAKEIKKRLEDFAEQNRDIL